MAVYKGGVRSVPGSYAAPRPSAEELATRFIRGWEERRREGERGPVQKLPPTITFSRMIGLGAKEIAGLLAPRIGYRVVDREIVEYIANEARLSEKTVALFDERYPGKINEFLSMAFGEKAFVKSDYTRHLFTSVFSIAGLGPTILVGRGAHLLLPRDRVLAVRFVSSREHRVRRLAAILNLEEREAESRVDQNDKEQQAFFKAVYGIKDVSPYEFDMVINCDYIREPDWAAGIVEEAFRRKFGETAANG